MASKLFLEEKLEEIRIANIYTKMSISFSFSENIILANSLKFLKKTCNELFKSKKYIVLKRKKKFYIFFKKLLKNMQKL